MTLHSSIKAIGTVAAQVVQAIAIVELPHNQWPELIGLLLGFVNQDNINLRVATLQAIGFICESLQAVRSHPELSLHTLLISDGRLRSLSSCPCAQTRF